MGCQKCLSEGGQHYSHPQRSLNHILKAMDYIKFENQGIKDIKNAIEIITEDYTKIRKKIEIQFKQVMEQLETSYDNCVFKLQQPLDNFSKLREIAEKYDNNIEFLKVVQQQEDKEQIQDIIASIIRNFDNFIIEDQNEYNNKLNEMGLYQEINKIVNNKQLINLNQATKSEGII
ncbi:hypothetical protein PPERSA_00456 [Pseudocohnilembus persalinus]|uniref:Uncharacterized protein n=1 Tax=Pseudocohnilembus persalinus TaxID=266149 RepID=A0A0V0R714_PSEPJ|nr:hypothetical protein PPERSA_00456 [Pseudocohnilembus persalinus]|eukprot:KRX10259.1 hypothetical protein PPERSA_00456 [Pseudocohnilembus persalinus]